MLLWQTREMHLSIDGPHDAPHHLSRATSPEVFAGRERALAYARGRFEYPPEVVAFLTDRGHLNRQSTVVDLGAGPGNLALRLAPWVRSVLAVEPSGEMVALGKTAVRVARMRGSDLSNVRWWESTSEAALPELAADSIDAITIAAALHWMDGPAVLEEAHRVLRPGGMIAVISGSSDPSLLGRDYAEPGAPLHAALERVIRKYGGNPSAPGNVATRAGGFAEMFARSPFRGSTTHPFPWRKDWDVDKLLHYLDSSSIASPITKGGRAAEFHDAIRTTVAADLGPDAQWSVTAPAVIRYVRKPYKDSERR